MTSLAILRHSFKWYNSDYHSISLDFILVSIFSSEPFSSSSITN